jgi:hypothetical protein
MMNLKKVPAPRRLEQLELYKHALAKTASRFRQEPANQRLVAVSKLATLIQITEVAIEKTATKNPGFF